MGGGGRERERERESWNPGSSSGGVYATLVRLGLANFFFPKL